ncbi:MAG: autotransporter outer membrane beta-barrel domain-containing protein [Alphaproteobacteria bacterium]|nr:autotransporter outer membrane beta-barrel domain-containing protein [Alphaproteobacteria bacterium]
MTAQTQRTETKEIVNLISGRISSALAVSLSTPGMAQRKRADADGEDGRMVGLSAGDGDLGLAVWGSYSHNWLANNWTATKSNTGLNSGIVGGDVRIRDNILAGLTVTNQASGATTKFNNGSIDSSGFTFTPYGAISFLDDRLVLDLMTGVGQNSTDTTRLSGLVRGSYSGEQWLLATHATYNVPVDNWTLSGKVGWASSYGWGDSYVESNGSINGAQVSRLGEISVGGRAAYTVGGFEPYLGLTFAYDPILSSTSTAAVPTTSKASRRELDGVLGLNWMATDRLTASAEAGYMFFRTNEENISVLASARYAF